MRVSTSSPRFLIFLLLFKLQQKQSTVQKIELKRERTQRIVVKMGEETVLLAGNLQSTSYCRICHEEELEGSKGLESPCSCSGTVKFAHRECIQRWCDEKGNTTCEICLKEYGPGYTAAPKKIQVMEEVVTIRGRLEIPREEDEAEDEMVNTECSLWTASFCKSVALILTILLLVRHLFDVLGGEAGTYPFSPVTMIALKSCGIIIPMYIIIHTITGIQNSIRKYNHLQQLQHLRHQDQQRLHITVDIQSQ